MDRILLRQYNNPYKNLRALVEEVLGFEIKAVRIAQDSLYISVFFNIEKEIIKTRTPILIQKINNKLNMEINRILIR